MCSVTKLWSGGVPNSVSDYSGPNICRYCYVFPAPPLSTILWIILFSHTSCILPPPHPPLFDWYSLLCCNLISPSFLSSGSLSTWIFPTPVSLHRSSLRFSSFPPSTCYQVSLSAPEVPRRGPFLLPLPLYVCPPRLTPSMWLESLLAPVGYPTLRSIISPPSLLSAPLSCRPWPAA